MQLLSFCRGWPRRLLFPYLHRGLPLCLEHFYGIQVIRITYREKKTGIGAAVWHGILQFVFLADVLDAMYLAVKKWGMGKKSSVVIGFLYVLMLAGGHMGRGKGEHAI